MADCVTVSLSIVLSSLNRSIGSVRNGEICAGTVTMRSRRLLRKYFEIGRGSKPEQGSDRDTEDEKGGSYNTPF